MGLDQSWGLLRNMGRQEAIGLAKEVRLDRLLWARWSPWQSLLWSLLKGMYANVTVRITRVVRRGIVL
ncbi:hypothetical protein LINPERPRIM_LOCUS3936 [Linum perenne]